MPNESFKPVDQQLHVISDSSLHLISVLNEFYMFIPTLCSHSISMICCEVTAFLTLEIHNQIIFHLSLQDSNVNLFPTQLKTITLRYEFTTSFSLLSLLSVKVI